MSDSELLDYLSRHPDCVKSIRNKYGKRVWAWRIGPEQYAEAFTLRSAIMAYKSEEEALPHGNE